MLCMGSDVVRGMRDMGRGQKGLVLDGGVEGGRREWETWNREGVEQYCRIVGGGVTCHQGYWMEV